MKTIHLVWLGAIMASLFIGCSSSSSDADGENNNAIGTTVTAVDGYIKNATIIDSSGGSNIGVYSSKGRYVFDNSITYPIYLSGGQYEETNTSFDINMSAQSGLVISPITTFVDNNSTLIGKLAGLNLDGNPSTVSDFSVDYIDANNSDLAKLAQLLYVVKTNVALTTQFKSTLAVSNPTSLDDFITLLEGDVNSTMGSYAPNYRAFLAKVKDLNAEVSSYETVLQNYKFALYSTSLSSWFAVEKIIDASAIADIDNSLLNPVVVRFDANNLHLYFAGVRYKTYATVAANVYRIKSSDNGLTWSAPEEMTQLEGNYQSYPVAYSNGRLLLVWHDGYHSELYYTDIADANSTVPTAQNYLSYETLGKEVTLANALNGRLMGMWANSNANSENLFPFLSTISEPPEVPVEISWSYPEEHYYSSAQISSDKVIVLSSENHLFLSDFNGSAFTSTKSIDFPDANTSIGYAGTTFYHGNIDANSGYIYFAGYNADKSKAAIYRTKYLDIK